MSFLAPVAESLASLTHSALPVALGAAIPLVATIVRRWLQGSAAQRLAAEAAFTAALNSDDLKKLSAYLRDEFGNVSLAIYLRDESLRDRLDKYLTRLNEFVAAPVAESEATQPPKEEDGAPNQAPLVERPRPTSPYWWDIGAGPPQIIAALESVRSGESWNALARLRRDLEARFRADIVSSGLPQSRIPVHKLPVPQDVDIVFRRFYRMASRAIHGEEVTDDDVIHAIRDARQVYEIMDQVTPGWSSRNVELKSGTYTTRFKP